MRRTSPRPPRLATWLMTLCPLGDRRAEVVADLAELFDARLAAAGVRSARRRYYRDVLSVWRQHRYHHVGAPAPRRTVLSTTTQDLAYAARLFRRHPLVVAVVVGGLAIGIGISTVAFTYFSAAFNRDYGVANPDVVVSVLRTYDKTISSQWPMADAEPLVGQPALSALALSVHGGQVDLGRTPDAGPAQGHPEFVGPGFFSLMGGRTALGRTLGPADDVPGDVPAVVLSHSFWSRRLAKDSAAIGSILWLNGIRVLVVGVMDRTFNGPSSSPVAVWVPLAAFGRVYGISVPFVTMHARLASAAAWPQAEAELSSLTRGMLTAPLANGVRRPVERVTLKLSGRPVWNARELPQVWMMVCVFGAVIGMILLLACANATNLLLASALSRRREIGVRLALGASRWRLIRQLITESVLLSAVSAVLGLLLASWLVPFIATLGGPEPGLNPSIDVGVYLFVVAITFVVGIAAGLAPARHGTGGDLMTPLKSETGGATGGARVGRLRALLVSGQAAASCLLLVIAALLIRAVVVASHLDLGMPVDRLIVASPVFNSFYMDAARVKEYWDIAEARVAAMPGVERIARADAVPFVGARPSTIVDGRRTNFYGVTPDYFDVAGLRILRGRAFTAAEIAARAPVAIISENLIHTFWPAQNPIGDTLARVDSRRADVRIIGITTNAVTTSLREPNAGSVYLPLTSPRDAQLVVRVSGSSAQAMGPITEALRAIDPALRPRVQALAGSVERLLGDMRSAAMVGLATGGTALALAIAGIFGVTAFVVGQRTREISLRMAIGATPANLVTLLLRQSLRPVVIGLAIGLTGAAFASQVLNHLLGGVSTHDPLAFIAAPAVLICAAGVAVLLPTRRAANIDPAPILRQ